jgi:hypothetical protein
MISVSGGAAMSVIVVVKFPGARVDKFSGLSVDYAERIGAKILLRSLRSVTDFDYEMEMTQMNKKMAPNIETVFMFSDPKLFFTASRLITRTGHQVGNCPYCGSTSLQLLMLRVMMPLRSSPLSAIGSRMEAQSKALLKASAASRAVV